MSVRIYQLSKEIDMENAELIELLRERGYEVKSASSTIDNISADSLREEFGPQEPEKEEEKSEPEAKEPEKKEPEKPTGAIVRSKEEIEEERKRREEEEEKDRAAKMSPPKTPSMPSKAPPPLPSKTSQIKSRPSGTDSSSGDSDTKKPDKPVLRTDIKEEPKEAKEEQEEKEAEKPAAKKGPAPLRPPTPPKKGPQPIAPPKAGPKNLTPPKSTEEKPKDEAKPEDSEDAAEDTGEEEVEEAAGANNLRSLQVKSPIVVRDFAVQIGKKPFQLISELMEEGIFASMNSTMEEEVATKIAAKHGFGLEVRHRGESGGEEKAPEEAKVEATEKAEPRPPVVCILGHVDHGKTTLLDTIRKTNVVKGEAGGITQHIGAYQIEHNGKKISFIDTPGHAAFSNMRARGANITDIAILVVAADDGFMPQTDEALGHARVAKVPIVVAINKMDAPGANVDKVKRQMQERELTPEDWGGETLSAEVSALKGDGIEDLLDSILLQAEVTETIVADPNAPVEGVILEAQKEIGRGSTASAIISKGTLKKNDALVCNECYCRVRQIFDDKGNPLKSAGPSTPVKIVGWSDPPDAGDNFLAVKNERTAKKEAEANELKRRQLEAAEVQDSSASVEDLFAAIEKTQKKSFQAVVKADVYGTAEALATSLLNIKSDKIDIDVVEMGVGDITRNDILMASAAEASIIGFNVGVENGVNSFAKHHGIDIIHHNIIYELITAVEDKMTDLLEPELRENKIGAAEIRQIFPLGKRQIAGCMVTEGVVRRDALARLMRKGEVVEESKIDNLKRFKDDATEVRAGYECGVQMQDVATYEEGDTIEVFEIQKIKPKL